LFKNGDRTIISNFRPISLLISFSKDFERVICWRLYQPINQNNILINEQYGFRINSSTLKASYTLINNILLEINNELTYGGIFCDLEKAFGCVNHDMLLLKLEFYRIVGKAYTLIKSNFSDRYKRVLADDWHYCSISHHLGES
jgi:hypothetical protein